MSRTFSTSSGSGDKVKVSVRCGCKRKARQIRAIVTWRSPVCLAVARELQCVAPRGVVSKLRMITASTCVWTRNRRFRPLTVPSRSCRCSQQAKPHDTHTYRRHGTGDIAPTAISLVPVDPRDEPPALSSTKVTMRLAPGDRIRSPRSSRRPSARLRACQVLEAGPRALRHPTLIRVGRGRRRLQKGPRRPIRFMAAAAFGSESDVGPAPFRTRPRVMCGTGNKGSFSRSPDQSVRNVAASVGSLEARLNVRRRYRASKQSALAA